MESVQEHKQRNRGLLVPLLLIVIGGVLLLERSGVIAAHTIWQLLPLLPIFIGGSLLAKRLGRRSE